MTRHRFLPWMSLVYSVAVLSSSFYRYLLFSKTCSPQLVILIGFTPWRSSSSLQPISILSSLFCLVKTSTELIKFRKQETADGDDKRTLCEKVQGFFKEKIEILKSIVYLSPLLVSSAIFNIGTIVLVVAVLRIFSIVFLAISFLTHLVIFFLVPLPYGIDQKLMSFMGFRKDVPKERPGIKDLPHGVLLSWKNLFILSCNLGKPNPHHTMAILYIQLIRFLQNTPMLIYITAFAGINENFKLCSISLVLIVCGVIFLMLTCNPFFNMAWLKMRNENLVKIKRSQEPKV